MFTRAPSPQPKINLLFDEGTGTDVDNTGTVGAGGDGTLTQSTLWAVAGTFTYDESTVNMTGDGKTMWFKGDTEFYNLTVAGSGKTTNIYNSADVAYILPLVVH